MSQHMSDQPQQQNPQSTTSASEDRLVLVDVLDQPVGSLGKLECHQRHLLHRAFSVFLWHPDADGTPVLLLQRRALGKYHSGGLWANSCCSHPRVGEQLDDAVRRRLQQEMGVADVRCQELGSFVYYASFPNGLAEYEYDHVYLGKYDGEVQPDPNEIMDIRWVRADELAHQLAAEPTKFAAWFITAAPMVLQFLATQQNG
ncbi:MAG: isopentenyl-diphosphate Delta-isomerase [Atopobiaceae bacterium]